MYTGRLPNEVLNGTLSTVLSDVLTCKRPSRLGATSVPYEIAET